MNSKKSDRRAIFEAKRGFGRPGRWSDTFRQWQSARQRYPRFGQ